MFLKEKKMTNVPSLGMHGDVKGRAINYQPNSILLEWIHLLEERIQGADASNLTLLQGGSRVGDFQLPFS